MQCFRCSEFFLNISVYILHLKSVHVLKTNDTYECSHNNCGKTFHDRSNFIKHLKVVHGRQDNSQSNLEINECTNNVLFEPINEDISKDFEMEVDTNVIESISVHENYEKQNMSDIFMKFLTFLHSDSTMTKKKIEEIYDKILSDILIPTLKNLELPDDSIKAIQTAHQSLDSFYKYQKKLKENNHMTESKMNF